MAKGKKKDEKTEGKDEQRSPLIPDVLARAIFDARRDVVKKATEHQAAKDAAAERKKELDAATIRVMELIVEAESGQTQLFEKAEGAGKPGKGE